MRWMLLRVRGRASISCMPESQLADVVVVGGGIIGMAVAWRLRERGMSVTLLDRAQTGAGTSHVAAGMLAPVAEVEFGEAGRRVLDLGLRSAELWPGFAAELQEASGMALALLKTGTLLVARDGGEGRALERRVPSRPARGGRAERRPRSQARGREPALAPTVRLALEAPEDHSIDPRPVLAALRSACLAAGVQLREHAPVKGVELDGPEERASGVRLADGERLAAGNVVLAAGPWSEEIEGLPPGARVPVRPVRGQGRKSTRLNS